MYANQSKKMAKLGTLFFVTFAAFVAALFPSLDPDTYFHLAAGRDIATTGVIPRTETLCFWAAGEPFINHEWLFDLLAWWSFDFGGEIGVSLFRATLSGLLFLLAALVAFRLEAVWWATLATSIAFLPIFRPSLELRPHLAGYTLAAAVLLVLLNKNVTIWRTIALIIIAVVWANSHGSFPLVVPLIILWALMPVTKQDHALERPKRLGVAALAGLSTLINPWGFGLIETVVYHTDSKITAMVPEWWPISWGEQPAFDALLLALIAGTLLSFLPKKNRLRFAEIGLVLLFLIPAVKSQKFVLGLAVGLAPVMAANLSRVLNFRLTTKLSISAASVLIAGLAGSVIHPSTSFGFGFDKTEAPFDAIDWASKANVGGKWFNPFDRGGFLAWSGQKPILDGRAYVHGTDRILNFVSALANPLNFQQMHRVLGFDAVLVDYHDTAFPVLTEYLLQSNDWALVWLDNRFAIFVPASKAQSLDLPTFKVLLPQANPLYLFDLPDSDVAKARAETDGPSQSTLGKPLSLLVKGLLDLKEAGLGWAPIDAIKSPTKPEFCKTAADSLKQLVSLEPDTPMYRYFWAISLVCNDQCEEALHQVNKIQDFPDAKGLKILIERGECP